MQARPRYVLAALAPAALAFAAAGGADSGPGTRNSGPAAAEFFEQSVRPVLAERCYSCHGSKIQQSGLRLDSRAAILKGGVGGPVVTAGDPDKSSLIHAVRYTGAVKMPPAGKLPPDQIAALEQWVRMGAPWPTRVPSPKSQVPSLNGLKPGTWNLGPTHWAFRPVRRPAIPQVRERGWVRSPIDAFILAKLEAKGLRPAPAADRRTLIRRATFDLTGLPPTTDEVDAFLADRSPAAWSKVVDRLLASPRFGERWGRHWLDLVRYCDSFDARLLGEQNAGRVMDVTEAWRYRDWVVKALNVDLPYDQFILYQVAGDLVSEEMRKRGNEETGEPVRRSEHPISPFPRFPISSPEAVVATGMLALGNWGGGDADKEKLLTDIADDQVDTVSRAFMGVTLACARCHDHKFDPFTAKDYYALAGIFFSTHILENVGPKTNGPPMLRIPLASPEELKQREQYAARLAELEKQVLAVTEGAKREKAKALLPETGRYLLAAWDYGRQDLPLEEFAVRNGLLPYALRQWREYLGLGDYRLLVSAQRDVHGKPGVHVWRGEPDCPNVLINTSAQEISILTFRVPPKSVAVHPGPSSGVVVGWRSPISGTVRVAGRLADADPVGGNGIAWSIQRRRPSGAAELASGEFANGGSQALDAAKGAEALRSVEVRAGDEIQVLVLPKNDYGFDTTILDLTIATDGQQWSLARDLLNDSLQGNPHSDSMGNPGVWRFSDTARSTTTAAALPAFWSGAVDAGDRAGVERAAAQLGERFRDDGPASPFWIPGTADEALLPGEARTRITEVREALEALKKAPPPPLQYANGTQEGGVPGSPHAGVHDVSIHTRGRYDRLGDVVPRGFPAVLTAEAQPPITQGSGRLELARWLARPDHPLTARVMVNRVWQHLFGEGIVRTPSNFGKLGERPSHPELLDWLAAAFSGTEGAWSIKKLIRKVMLSSAYQQSAGAGPNAQHPTLNAQDPDNRLFGRMNRKRLEAEAIRDSLLAASGRLDLAMGGPATREFSSPRRSLYQMTVRSDRTGFGPLFDVADSTNSIDRRTESTVAPQALFMWNHPFVLEQSRALAKRLQAQAGTDAERIRSAYGLLYGRLPSEEETHLGVTFVARSGPRAWEEYALILLCANEFIYVD